MIDLITNLFAAGTLALHLSTNAVGYAQRSSGPGGSLCELANWHYVSNSGTNLANLTNDPWSARCWLAGIRGLSATSIGFSNQLAAQGMVSMVSPRHYLFAAHMHPEHLRLAFLDTNNVVHWRWTLQRDEVGFDTAVGILDRDLPPSVGYLPVLPVDYTNYLPVTGRVQGIGMNQDLRLFGEPMILRGSFVSWDSHEAAPHGLDEKWNVTIRGGDSSNPALLLIGDQLVLVSHNSSVNGGPNYAWQEDAINRSMHKLSVSHHAGTDYQLTVWPLTNWPVIGP